MIRLEDAQVLGWEAAIRGMRNPMNSWKQSDTLFIRSDYCDEMEDYEMAHVCGGFAPIIKKNDQDLMMRLRNAGTDHRKFMRMITVYVDITAPLYWWKEFDTYKVGTVANSCSTMHKIHDKEFTLDDFSTEHLNGASVACLSETIILMNEWRKSFNDIDSFSNPEKKEFWWQMIQLLPSSYNQKRTVMLNYEVLANIYKSRKNHKLDEWKDFCKWIESLPYSELITGGDR